MKTYNNIRIILITLKNTCKRYFNKKLALNQDTKLSGTAKK